MKKKVNFDLSYKDHIYIYHWVLRKEVKPNMITKYSIVTLYRMFTYPILKKVRDILEDKNI